MDQQYDIFISYKRKSLPTANNLYYRLTTRGYSTFFDLEELGRDNFNVQLLSYIEKSKDVFVILEEGSLDGCKSDDWEEDWFCHEIAFALEKKKNIIPILIGGYQMPSEDFFPDKLKELRLKNAPEFNFSFFEAYLDKLIEKDYLLSKPNLQEKATSVFKFYSNEDCQVYKEGKMVCSLERMSDKPYYLPVPRKGEYRFKAVSAVTNKEKIFNENIDAAEEKIVEIKWRATEYEEEKNPQHEPKVLKRIDERRKEVEESNQQKELEAQRKIAIENERKEREEEKVRIEAEKKRKAAAAAIRKRERQESIRNLYQHLNSWLQSHYKLMTLVVVVLLAIVLIVFLLLKEVSPASDSSSVAPPAVEKEQGLPMKDTVEDSLVNFGLGKAKYTGKVDEHGKPNGMGRAVFVKNGDFFEGMFSLGTLDSGKYVRHIDGKFYKGKFMGDYPVDPTLYDK